MKKRKKILIISSFLLIVLAGLCTAGVVIGLKPAPVASVSSTEAACTLDPQTFMATVNQWRSATGASPLTYSNQLQAGATARIADMVNGQYFGHTNPVTKEQAYTAVAKFDPAASYIAEVLDGPNSAAQSITDFRNSSEHYNALINPDVHYFAAVAVYQPESWADYDNNGNVQTPAGKNHSNCLVVGEVADKSGNTTEANSTPANSAASTVTSSTKPPAPTSTNSAEVKQLACIQQTSKLVPSLTSSFSSYSSVLYAQETSIPANTPTDEHDTLMTQYYATYNDDVSNAYTYYKQSMDIYGCPITVSEPSLYTLPYKS